MKWLTKSDYLKYLIHPALLWLVKYDKDKLPPFDEGGHFNVDQGNEVESYARQLFPEGILIDAPIFDKAAKTTEVLQQFQGNQSAFFQASVLTERRLFASADVLVKNSGKWDLYEVKSSSAVKYDHINDLAFQKVAFEEGGYLIDKTYVVHINNKYTRRGEIEPKKLFQFKDVTEEVEVIIGSTRQKISEALKVLELSECPDQDPKNAFNLGAWLRTYRFLNPDLVGDSIYSLKRVTPAQLRQFSDAGITLVKQIPINSKLTSDQRVYLESLLLNRAAVHHGKIEHWISQLKFPLYFLDYETFNTAIPLWDGQRPYQQLPFQYSLHILDEPGGELVQKEFLARGTSNPVQPLVTQLARDLGPVGSVLVWYKDFEMGCNDRMAALHPDFADFLSDVNGRIEDLMEVFSNHWYVDPKFGGSNSIKKVLPVLVPTMSYQGLGINKGDMAQVRWTRAAKGDLTTEEGGQVYRDLVEYCRQDTLAMVLIYEVLLKTVPARTVSRHG